MSVTDKLNSACQALEIALAHDQSIHEQSRELISDIINHIKQAVTEIGQETNEFEAATNASKTVDPVDINLVIEGKPSAYTEGNQTASDVDVPLIKAFISHATIGNREAGNLEITIPEGLFRDMSIVANSREATASAFVEAPKGATIMDSIRDSAKALDSYLDRDNLVKVGQHVSLALRGGKHESLGSLFGAVTQLLDQKADKKVVGTQAAHAAIDTIVTMSKNKQGSSDELKQMLVVCNMMIEQQPEKMIQFEMTKLNIAPADYREMTTKFVDKLKAAVQ